MVIYTVTLNPSLDYVMHLEQLKNGLTNRSHSEALYVGGKGINVSMVLKQLDQPTTILGLIAGFTGEAIKQEIERLHIPAQLISLSHGFSRINVKLKGTDETEINGSGPIVQQQDFEKLLDCLHNICNDDFLVLSGSIPSGLNHQCYIDMMNIATEKGARVIVDAAGENLRQTLRYRPFLVKPNRQELEDFFHITLDATDYHQIVNAAKRLQQEGAANVLVSLGGDGSLLLDETGMAHIMPAAGGVPINTVGAGDSMIAGFITGIALQRDYSYALRLGTACGGATAFSTGLADAQTISRVLSTLPPEQHFHI